MKNNRTRLIILMLAVVALSLFFYNYSHEKKENQILIVERNPIRVRLVELKAGKNNYLVKIQDTKTGEIYDEVSVSRICPLFEHNQLGRTMDIEKVVFYHTRDDIKEDGFEGLYDYLCTRKKDNKNL